MHSYFQRWQQQRSDAFVRGFLMKYKNNILGFTAVAVVVVLAVTSVLTCVNIIGSDKHISMYDNDPQKMIADNFPFSEHLKKVGIISNEILSDNIVNNVYSNGKMLLPVNSETNTQGLKKTVDDINIISKKLNGTSYFTIVPTASAVYSNIMPQIDSSGKEADNIIFASSVLDKQIKFINIYNTLCSSDDNYIFYRTDSLWTSEGAYYAYKRIIRKIGFNPTDYSDYNIVHMKSDYYGNLYDLSGINNVDYDYIDRFKSTKKTKILNVIRSDDTQNTSDSIYYDDFLNIKGKELFYYLGNPCSVIDIETNVNNSKTLLIFKDSFANEMIEFLSHHYKHITIVDPSLISDGDMELILNNEYTDILFICGYKTAESGGYFAKINSYLTKEKK